MGDIKTNIVKLFVGPKGNIPSVRTAQKYLTKIKTNYKNEYDYINSYLPNKTIENGNINEILYCIINDIQKIPSCPICGNNCKFNGWKKGYAKTCSQKCHIQNQQNELHKSGYYELRKELRNKKENPWMFYDWTKISEECDKWILDNFLRFNRTHICPDTNKLPGGMWYEGNINKDIKEKIISYIHNRFENSNDIEENLYWLYHKLEKRPVCEVCGKPVKFKGFICGYQRTCSHSCKTLHPDTKAKLEKTCLERYGSNNVLGNFEIRKRAKETMIKRHQENYYNRPHSEITTWSSKGEQHIFKILKELYPDSLQFYRDKRYSNPRNGYCWECDFYIPSKDIFIEYQGFRSHGLHPYNKYNIDDCNKLTEMKNKLKLNISDGVRRIIESDINVWTKHDVFKRTIAKINNLKYIEIFERNLNKLTKQYIENLIKEKGE